MIRYGGSAHLYPQHFCSGGRRVEDLQCSRSADPAADGMLRAPVSSMTTNPPSESGTSDVRRTTVGQQEVT